jgi:hypothetical protein
MVQMRAGETGITSKSHSPFATDTDVASWETLLGMLEKQGTEELLFLSIPVCFGMNLVEGGTEKKSSQ